MLASLHSSLCGKVWVYAHVELPMGHVSTAWIIQTFVNNYLGTTSAFLRGGKKHQAHWALLVPHWGSLQTLLMPWVPFCMCPLGLDHTGTGVFSIWSQSIFWCFDEVAVHGLMKVLEGKAFSFGLVLCRQMQTPPSSSCFFKKLCKSCFWS